MTDNHLSPFFVLGLPRSRTAWLAALLTEGNRLCLHEGVRRYDTLPDYITGLGTILGEGIQVGDSSPLIPFGIESVLKAWPAAKFLVVKREPADALQAAIASCPAEQAGRIERGWPVYMAAYDAAIDQISKQARPIKYDDLEYFTPLQEAVEWLTGSRLDFGRHLLFNGFNITVQSYEADDWTWLQDYIPKRVVTLIGDIPGWRPGWDAHLSARLAKPEDLDLMERWNLAHRGHGIERARVPALGLVIETYGQPVGMMWAQLAVDRSVAYLEDPITEPGLGVATSTEVLHYGLGAIKAALKALDYDVLIANTSKPFARYLLKWGWNQREDGLVKLEISTAA